MKLNKCFFGFHDWRYSDDEKERICTQCKKFQVLVDNIQLSAFDNPHGDWITVKNPQFDSDR